MIPVETFLLFFTSSLLLALAPGPDNIFVLAQSAQHGRRAGLIVTLGLCTGILVHTAAVSLGVAAIFQTSMLAFNLLKGVGAAYLLYLAYLSFKASGVNGVGSVQQLSMGKLYRRGVIMNVTNPKVSIFFMAFLPQFVDPARGSIVFQMLILGAVFIVSTILIFGAVSLLAGTFGQWLARSERAGKILNRTAGSIFMVLAVKLMTAHK
ncbi:LysE family translocator [Desulfopila aestuarii]|uniref:Threonine/homoserine/homoserine lactone efflux protein n=1 Tax=Desulfopila aestuarii DSM 18488 TaxID=1121416 RepID=A0A1M7Y9N5_9BACT|nr:LysE family translocator [Desulfopila aestuarii]SHO49342.1 Threonine/homoserine/homoserine lactone efflux protein [Desulfopila aestuarii DSM 18488]